MILGLTVGVVFLAVALGVTWLSFRFQRRPDGVPRWPAPDRPRADFSSTFAAALEGIGVEAGPLPEPDYRTGEYPTVPAVEQQVVEQPAADAPRGEHVARHAADEDLVDPDAPPWRRPTLLTEPTPFFWSTGTYPVCTVNLSATDSWNRADLLRRLGMDEGAAA